MNAIWLILVIIVWLLKPEQATHCKLTPKGMENKSVNTNLTWEEYKLFAEFYKFFLDFALKANVFFYAITGAILTILYNPSTS